MSEKTVKCNKSIILLRSLCLAGVRFPDCITSRSGRLAVSFRILPVIIAVVVLISSLAFPASAAVLDYRDYIVDIVVEGDKDLVTLYIPSSMAYWHILDHAGNISLEWTGNVAGWHTGEVHNVQFFPFGKDNVFTLDDFPDGTEVTFGIYISSQTQVLYSATDLYMVYPFSSEFGIIDTDGSGTNILFDYTFVIDRSFADGNFYVRADIDSVHSLSGGHVEYSAGPTTVTFSISSAYRDYIENGKNQDLMEEIKNQLEEQGKTLEDLAGNIGDEFQGVIDNEKNEAQSSGNKFVDQILGALPDPSTDVLAALKKLTDATAYTGTDAVLPIPAIVLPGIDGLFPETEIWSGAEFDFGDYLDIIPSSLLTLVRSLFTIAIVLFCVYELKGIISYCLTLRESKGG